MSHSTVNTSLRVTELEFHEIKNNLKNYLRGKPEFTDYDFAGSALSTVLDILAYNTYYQSFYLNMVANEMYLDSAITKPAVNSLSKALNYLPRSARSSQASLVVRFVPNDSPDEIVIPRFTRFSTRINGVIYEFTTSTPYSVLNVGGLYQTVVKVYEGIVLTYTFPYSSSDRPYFELPVPNLDTSSLIVEVKPNAASSTKAVYTLVSDLTEVESDSEVYYLQKSMNDHYEVYFGDGILGKELEHGNIVLITFRTCNGDEVNGANTFLPVGYTGFNKAVPTTRYEGTVLSTTEPASEGQDEAELEEIRFNAPRSYEMQNRLVTALDYQQYILNNYSDIGAVNAWGGEDNDPPIYGKALIAVKPVDGFVISNARKEDIIRGVQKYTPMSIDPLIVDPIFLFIRPVSTVYYDATTTTLTSQQLFNKVSTAVQNFEHETLGTFGNHFKFSRYSMAIDHADDALTSNDTTLLMEKRFNPTLNSSFTYSFDFQNPFHHPYDGFLGCLTSTSFTILGSDETMFLDDDGNGVVRIYFFDSDSEKVYFNSTAGTINYELGHVTLTSFHFTGITGDEMHIRIMPRSGTIFADKNMIILLAFPSFTMYDLNQNRSISSHTVDVVGNESLVRSSAILNTILL